MKIKLSLILFIFFSIPVFGFSVLTLKPVNWSQVDSVDIFVAGYGAELGNQFLYSAITKARVMDGEYPDSRVQLIFWANEKGRDEDLKTLEQRDLNILAINDDYLTAQILFREVKRHKRISSLHILSHSAAFYGARIQSRMTRVDGKHFPWESLRNHFIDESYVILHGCNTGFSLAPQVSKAIQRPVLGSLSSTDFQEIFSDGKWYHNNRGQYPDHLSRASSSSQLYSSNHSCWKGNCHRLMPNNHPYRGYWGEYEVGLPFFKNFCNFSKIRENKQRDCYSGIAQAIRGWPTLEGNSFESKVFDFLCPRYGSSRVFEKCVSYLLGEGESKFFWGKTLNCSLEKCDYNIVNTLIEGETHPSVRASLMDQGMQPIRDEYLLLQKARPYF